MQQQGFQLTWKTYLFSFKLECMHVGVQSLGATLRLENSCDMFMTTWSTLSCKHQLQLSALPHLSLSLSWGLSDSALSVPLQDH
jgi:hypothetical protein